jgi:hypothetical protein
MTEVRQELRQRMRDILAYIRMLRFIEQAGGTVTLQARNMTSMPLGQSSVHVLKAGVFLHLYNLVESTVTSGMEHIADQIKSNSLLFQNLTEHWQRAWAKGFAKLDEDLGADRRLTVALEMCNVIANGMSIKIKPKIGLGNLDDRRIEEIAKRYGIQLIIRPAVQKAVKHQVLNELGFLGLVRQRRNDLAHGHDSFADIGRNYSITDLTRWSWATYQYLKELLGSFDVYVRASSFARPPAAPPPTPPGAG